MKEIVEWNDSDLITALSNQGMAKERAVDYLMKVYIHYVPAMIEKIGLS